MRGPGQATGPACQKPGIVTPTFNGQFSLSARLSPEAPRCLVQHPSGCFWEKKALESGDSGQSRWSSLKWEASSQQPSPTYNREMGPSKPVWGVCTSAFPSPQPAAPPKPPGPVSPEKPKESTCSLPTGDGQHPPWGPQPGAGGEGTYPLVLLRRPFGHRLLPLAVKEAPPNAAARDGGTSPGSHGPRGLQARRPASPLISPHFSALIKVLKSKHGNNSAL